MNRGGSGGPSPRHASPLRLADNIEASMMYSSGNAGRRQQQQQRQQQQRDSDSMNAGSLRCSPARSQQQQQQQATSFKIIVAARIRPFTRKELQRWHKDQQLGAAAAAALPPLKGGNGGGGGVSKVAAVRTAVRRARGQQRQPFGPGQGPQGDGGDDELLDEGVLSTLRAANPALAGALQQQQQHRGGRGGGGVDDGAAAPTPVMDVEGDGHTVTLLDPSKPGIARAAFTFDHVFSSFAPTVELLPTAMDSFKQQQSQQSQQQPMIAGDEASLSPQQDRQAEEEQVQIFETVGRPLLENALSGFNACIFAYGQTGSGKTHTMLGTRRHRGIMPRLLYALFEHLDAGRAAQDGDAAGDGDGNDWGGGGGPSPLALPSVSRSTRSVSNPRESSLSSGGPAVFTDDDGTITYVDLAFMEIYNEQVKDLLKQRPKKALLHYNSRFDTKDVEHGEYQTLKVRQHPEHGPFVEGLTTVRVASWEECEQYLRQGSQLRTQAATSMNETSSRSHAILQVSITREESLGGRVRGKEVTTRRVSKVNLVDLAGSERNSANATSTKGKKSHLQEANSINVSLSTLRRVIEALVVNTNNNSNNSGPLHHHGGKAGGNGKAGQPPAGSVVVPYRESLLTFVLADNFGGNSRTVMFANVSPAEYNLNETESTLRYATLARGVRNRVRVTEDPTARIVRELQSRVTGLQAELAMAPSPRHIAELELDLEENEAALAEIVGMRDDMAQQLREQEATVRGLQAVLETQQRQEREWRRRAEREQEENARLRETLRRLTEENALLLERQQRQQQQQSRRKSLLPEEREAADGDGARAAAVSPRSGRQRGSISPSARRRRTSSFAGAVSPKRGAKGGAAKRAAADATRRRGSSVHAIYGGQVPSPPTPSAAAAMRRQRAGSRARDAKAAAAAEEGSNGGAASGRRGRGAGGGDVISARSGAGFSRTPSQASLSTTASEGGGRAGRRDRSTTPARAIAAAQAGRSKKRASNATRSPREATAPSQQQRNRSPSPSTPVEVGAGATDMPRHDHLPALTSPSAREGGGAPATAVDSSPLTLMKAKLLAQSRQQQQQQQSETHRRAPSLSSSSAATDVADGSDAAASTIPAATLTRTAADDADNSSGGGRHVGDHHHHHHRSSSRSRRHNNNNNNNDDDDDDDTRNRNRTSSRSNRRGRSQQNPSPSDADHERRAERRSRHSDSRTKGSKGGSGIGHGNAELEDRGVRTDDLAAVGVASSSAAALTFHTHVYLDNAEW